MHAAFLLGLMACNWFKGCAEPDIPSPPDQDDDDNQQDTSPEDDTAVDTGPPPPCAFPEVEPNNSVEDAQPIDMEAWACGVLDQPAEFDAMQFSNVDDGWMKVWVRGADIGSAADLQVFLTTEDGDYGADGDFQYTSTDPLLVVPVPAGLTWYAIISDQYYTYSDQHVWEMIASMTKAPVDWTIVEVEDNDTPETGQPVESGDWIYGFMDHDNDNDYYVFDVPEGGKTTVTAKVYAFRYGSPVDAALKLWDPSGKLITHDRHGETSSDRDASFETTVSDPGTWALQLADEDNIGGPLCWYVLSIEYLTEYDDTGAADEGGAR